VVWSLELGQVPPKPLRAPHKPPAAGPDDY